MIFEALERIGRIKRTGWVISKIPFDLAEDVAEHTLKVAFLTMHVSNLMASKGVKLNVNKALKMALIHDLSEAMVSDLPKTLKRKLGREKVGEIDLNILFDILSDFKGRDELVGFFNEYLTDETVEAKVVSLADNLATYLQCMSYIEDYGIRTKHLMEIKVESLNEVLKLVKDLNLNREELQI